MESVFPSGCDDLDLCSFEVAQHVLLAQHAGLQTFCSGALERMHDRALRATGPVKSAAAVAIEIMILLNIDLRIAQVRPRVEKSVHRHPTLGDAHPLPARCTVRHRQRIR
ncbi:MAG: hypothetical protein DME98_11140 [Verrucomicrobia bacterium]|nr:MAG: hypothetical protein DME98_11140 [Verrucomicrobiota bacterium]PYJ31805.1 MAG: hypothetical protein DME88_13400 [Verrucomicrobiota bacterium]